MTTHAAITHRLLLTRALTHVKAQRVRKAEYEAECREWARQGYRAHHCPHGRDLWVDYDVICGPCEDGLSIHQIALMTAHDEVRTFTERLDIANRAHHAHAPEDVRAGLFAWAMQAISYAEEN